jgi:phospholipid/cholesterol/gamma-HCH transport system ATP-binding protein
MIETPSASIPIRRIPTRAGHGFSGTSQPVVAFRNVSIAFDGPPVLQDVSFSVAPRETRILLGPAGVGKSVLLKLTNGLLRPDQGSILLFGRKSPP